MVFFNICVFAWMFQNQYYSLNFFFNLFEVYEYKLKKEYIYKIYFKKNDEHG